MREGLEKAQDPKNRPGVQGRYTLEQAREEAEILQDTAVLIALKKLGFTSEEAIEYAQSEDQFDTQSEDYTEASKIVDRLNEKIKSQFGTEMSPDNDDISKLPGYKAMHILADTFELTPTIEGKLLFKREGQGRVFGRQPSQVEHRDVSYYGFVQTEFGRIYVQLGQGPRGEAESNINKPVGLSISFPNRFTTARGRRAMTIATVVNREGYEKQTDDNKYLPRSSYVPWKTLLGVLAMRDSSLDAVIEMTQKEFSNARGRKDERELHRQAILHGVLRLKGWYCQKLLGLESETPDQQANQRVPSRFIPDKV